MGDVGHCRASKQCRVMFSCVRNATKYDILIFSAVLNQRLAWQGSERLCDVFQLSPSVSEEFEAGVGLAVSSSLGMVAMSHQKLNAVSVYRITGPSIVGAGAGGAGARDGPLGTPTAQALRLQHHCTINNSTSGVFDSLDFSRTSGWLAFLEVDGVAPLLLVSDSNKGAVHMFDVHSGQHAGYLVAPGGLLGARGVAVSSDCSTIAVVAYRTQVEPGNRPVVKLFSAFGARDLLREIHFDVGVGDGELTFPRGVAFSPDGATFAIVDFRLSGLTPGSHSEPARDASAGMRLTHSRVSVFRTATGSFSHHALTDVLEPRDVVSCRGGWLVVGMMGSVYVNASATPQHVIASDGKSPFTEPLAAAVMPGVGLLVRGTRGLQLFEEL